MVSGTLAVCVRNHVRSERGSVRNLCPDTIPDMGGGDGPPHVRNPHACEELLMTDLPRCPCCRRPLRSAPLPGGAPVSIFVPRPGFILAGLRAVAAEFDAVGDERFTAADFVDYLETTLRRGEM